MGGFSQGFAQGSGEVDARKSRSNQLEDEQRRTKQDALGQQLATGAITAPQYGSGVSDLYAHEPAESRLGRIHRGLERAVGMKKQADQQKAQADAKLASQPSPKADYANIQAGAKSPQDLAAEKQTQAISTFTQEGDIGNKQAAEAADTTRQATVALIDKYVTDPEANKAAKQEYAQKQAGIFGSPKPLTGAAGEPVEYPPGSGQYAQAVSNPDGTRTMMPMPLGWKPPAPKPSTSPAGIYTNLLAKKIMADNKTGPPLTPQESASLQSSKSAMTIPGIARAEAWARASAANNLVVSTDPSTGMDVLVSRAQGVAATNAGQPMTAGVVGAPTGNDKKNQMLAQSAIAQVDRMQSILRQDPNLTGPGAGQLTTLQTWLGTQDPDAQAFIVSSLLGSEHGVAVFGGRNIHTISDLQSAIGSMKTNPKALAAALQVIKETMQPWTTANGRLPAPRNATGGGTHSYAIDGAGKRHKVLDSKAQLPQGWKWGD
jgi:hypothetical protein